MSLASCPDAEGQPATCPAGTVQVDTCSSAECVIARGDGDACNDVVYCEAETQCLGLATCAEGQVNVSTETCLSLGEQCMTHTLCGQTLHCVEIPEICSLHWGSDDQCSTYTYCR